MLLGRQMRSAAIMLLLFSMLKQEWKEDLSTNDAILLALKVLSKTMDSSTLSSEKLEFSTLTLGPGNVPKFHILTSDELKTYLTQAKEIREKEEKEKERKKEGGS
eukprot:TRINITY_DN6858_c0_g1_i2.p1 TRINITY_DN6858_c0_g1~~TRINITY_DN6858_c0_g1_i2.p1  ORF type:complete len:105 (+),score=23.57 TRINITY_DN6858_c0_g1_i2:223-537(+)